MSAMKFNRFNMRHRAHRLLRDAVRSGLVKPWPLCAMPDCPRSDVVAHQSAYGFGDALYVTWLCRHHHVQLHLDFIRTYKKKGSTRRRQERQAYWQERKVG